MNFIGRKIKHKLFGEGIVQAQEGSIIRIGFGGETGQKSFLYPDAFETYLAAQDPELYELVSDAITQKRLREQQAREAKRQEEERRLEEARQQKLSMTRQRRKSPGKATMKAGSKAS